MKKVLLTTTALVMTAGVAAAEISFSGTAQVAITDDNGRVAAVDNTAAQTDYQLTTGLDFNVAVSAATDNGITMSSSFDMGAGTIVDYNDDDKLENQAVMAADDGIELTIGWNGYTISAEQNGVDNLYNGDFVGDDLGISGAMGAVTFAATADMETDASSVKLGYTMGDLTATYTQTNKQGNTTTATAGHAAAQKIAVSYVMGDLTITASSDDKGVSTTNDNENKVGFSYKMDSITLAYTSIDPEESGKGMGDEWDASIAYSAGALTASYAVDEADATTLIAEYDLGGGATFFVASHDKPAPTGGTATDHDMTTAGINFKF